MVEGQQTAGTDEPWTCGKGLAEHAAIPAKMAAFLNALAENLDAHVPTIDTSDANGRMERDAYVGLATEYAEIAAGLGRTAERMRSYRDLPAARHHENALSEPGLAQAFEMFVALETELADLLSAAAESDGQLLRQSEAANE